MRRLWAIAAVGLATAVGGCDGGQPTDLAGVQSIIYIQRTAGDTGNVFEYTMGGDDTAKADIILLSPPTASGTRTNLTNLGPGADVMAMDLSFDATEIVFSARLTSGDHYHLFRINADGSNPCTPGQKGFCQITDGPNDEVYPTYMPGNRVFFMSNQNVEANVPQFHDEYERATTVQVASVNRQGGDLQLGARNVSHRVSPTLLADGRMLMTQWDHLGGKNEGNLVIMNQDLTGQREGFGKEQQPGSVYENSYLHAREFAPGQLVTVGTSRDRTYHAGKLLWVNLGKVGADGKVDLTTLSEANASSEDLTPDVPGDRTPSYYGVGRYYDAYPIGDVSQRKLLVTWSDGPVETEALAMAGKAPSFGIYLYDAIAKTRFPIAVPTDTSWYTCPIPVAQRAEPPMLSSASNMAMGTQSTLISAINVYDSTIEPQLTKGQVFKVRIMEGFSDEEGVPDMFGLTEFDGHALLGEIDPCGDGSFKAVVPANIPVHIQLVDQFGMSLKAEPVWIQGRSGEARVCGGCHEDRTKTPQISPGSSALQAVGAAAFDFPRAQRASTNYTPEAIRGLPWDKTPKGAAGAIQPIFDAHCVDCHDGSANGANPSYTIQDLTDNLTFSFTFDLTNKPVNVQVGTRMYGYTASHLSLLGPSMMFEEKQVVFVNGVMPGVYIEPGSAATSDVIKRLNPPQRYPTADLTKRAFGGAGQVHPADVTTAINGHSGADAKYVLSADEQYIMELMADMGGQFYSRENAPGGSY